MKKTILFVLLITIAMSGFVFPQSTGVQRLIGKEDLRFWDGINSTFTRRTSTGGSLTLNAIGEKVDVVSLFPSAGKTASAIDQTLQYIAGKTATVVLAPGTWTIAANKDWSAFTNIIWEIPTGAVISHGSYNVTFGGTVIAGINCISGTGTRTFAGFYAGCYQVFAGSGSVVFGLGAVTQILPEWWGAKADGTTASGAPILAALTCAGASGGGVVHLQAGTYLTAVSLIVPSYTTLQGSGRGATTIKAAATGIYLSTVLAHAATKPVVRDLTVDNYTLSAPVNGIEFVDSNDAFNPVGTATTGGLIENCEVLGVKGHHYYIWIANSNDNIVRGCAVDGKVAVPDGSGAIDQNGIEIMGGTNTTVENCTVQNMNNAGILIFNTIAGTDNVKFLHNTVRNCYYGIASMGGGAGYGAITGLTVDGNDLISNLSQNFLLNSTDYYDVLVANNRSYNAGPTAGGSTNGTGFEVYLTTEATKNFRVIGNSDWGAKSTNTGSFYFNGGNGILFANNASYAPIYMNFITNASTDFLIEGNHFEAAKANAVSLHNSRIRFLNNTIKEWDTAHSGVSATVAGINAYYLSNGSIIGNSFYRAAGSGQMIENGGGDKTIIRGNYNLGSDAGWVMYGTNASYGTTPATSGGETYITVTNSRALAAGKIRVIQVAGTAVPFFVNVSGGVAFYINAATTFGAGVQFSWEILQ